jgi:hypothetical protein
MNDSDIDMVQIVLNRMGGVGGKKCDKNKSR